MKFQYSRWACSSSFGQSCECASRRQQLRAPVHARDGHSAASASEIARPPRDTAAQRKKPRPSPPSQPTAGTTRCTLKRASMSAPFGRPG
eukprot:2543094-Prymnesium_polylepis.2